MRFGMPSLPVNSVYRDTLIQFVHQHRGAKSEIRLGELFLEVTKELLRPRMRFVGLFVASV